MEKEVKKELAVKFNEQALFFVINHLPDVTKLSGVQGEGGWCHPSLEVLFIFFLDDKTSAPEVFSSCSFIPRARFETSLVMISYYMVRRCVVIRCRWSSHF